MLKFEIDAIDDLDDAVKALYEPAGEKYRLKVDGVPAGIKPEDFDALKSSVERLEAKNRELLEEKKRAKQEAEQAALDAAKKGGDVEALEKSWQQKVQAIEQDLAAKIAQYERMVSDMTSGAEAIRAASELALSGSADVLLPHIQRRLSTEVKDGKAIVRVLDADGRPSAMSIADLKKEIAANPAFAPILVGARANGSGPPGRPGSAAGKKFNEIPSGELAQLRRQNPAEYERLKAEFYGSA